MEDKLRMGNSSAEEDAEAFEVRARQNVVLCMLGLIFNGILLAVVFISVRLRKSSKYQLIASLSLADVLLGVIYLPLDTTMAMEGGVWRHGCGLLLFTYGLQEFVMPTIASLTLSALCIEYSATMVYSMTPAKRRRIVVVGVCVPWALGLLAFVPVFLKRVVTSSGTFSAGCVDPSLDASTLILLVGVFGFLPLAFLGGSLLLMIVCHCCRPPDDRILVRTIIGRSEGVYLTHEFADTFFACLISLTFNLPFLLDFCLHVQCEGTRCHSPTRAQHVLEVLRTTESVFFPAVWMLGMEFRQGLFTSCKCCYRYCDVDMEHSLH